MIRDTDMKRLDEAKKHTKNESLKHSIDKKKKIISTSKPVNKDDSV